MTPTELAWLSGYLEGEGCFHFPETPCIQVGATDEDVVTKAASLMGTKIYRREARKPGWKPCYLAVVRGDAARELMVAILPFMGSRRSAKIREVLNLAACRPGRACGERSGRSTLSDAAVLEMRQFAAGGVSGQELARCFGVTSTTVSQVLTGKAWRHLAGPLRVPCRGGRCAVRSS